MKEQNSNFETLASQLYTDIGKANFIVGLIGKQKIPEDTINWAIDTYKKKEWFRTAEATLEKSGMFDEFSTTNEDGKLTVVGAAYAAQEAGLADKAIDIYEKAEWPEDAYEEAKNAGSKERANELLKIAIKKRVSEGNFYGAATLAEEGDLLENALEYYAKSSYSDAARLAKKMGMLDVYKEMQIKAVENAEKVIESRLSRDNYIGAIEAAQDAGLKKRAKEIAEKGIEFYENVDIYMAKNVAQKAGMLKKERVLRKKIIEHCEKHGTNLEYAAHNAEKLGMKEKAIELKKKELEKIMTNGRVSSQAERLELADPLARRFYGNLDFNYHSDVVMLAIDTGAVDVTIERLKNEGFYRSAAVVAYHTELKALGVDVHMAYGNPHNIQRLLRDNRVQRRGDGLQKLGIEEYERRGSFTKAAFIAELMEMPEKAVELYEKSGNLARASRLAHEEEMFDKAKELFKKEIDLQDDQTSSRDDGQISAKNAAAKKEMEEILEQTKDDPSDPMWVKHSPDMPAGYLPAYATAAEVAEGVGMIDKAIELYISGFMYDFAANLAERAGMVKRALELSEEGNMFDRAAKIAGRNGMKERADFYEKVNGMIKGTAS